MADIPLRLDADPQWQLIHRAADAQAATVERIFYRALAALITGRVLRAVSDALGLRDPDRAVAAIPLDAVAPTVIPQLDPILLDIALQGAGIAQTATRARLAEFAVRLGTNEGLPVAGLEAWAARHAGEMVREVTSETRFAVRRIIEQGVHTGTSPAKTAELVVNVVGLTNRQAQAVKRYAEALAQGGASEARVSSLMARYARTLLRHRAEVIARNETLTAANMGRRAQWQRELEQGLILPDRWEREWVAIVPSDGRTCPYCEGQDGQRAPIGGSYPDGSGGPPGHVICRCTEKLVRSAA